MKKLLVLIVCCLITFTFCQENASEYDTYLDEGENTEEIENLLFMRRLVRAVSRAASSVSSAASSAASSISSAASSAASSISNAASGAINKITDYYNEASDFIDSVSDLATDTWNQIKGESRDEETTYTNSLTNVPNTPDQRENEAISLLTSYVAYKDPSLYDFQTLDLGVPALKNWRFLYQSSIQQLKTLLYVNDQKKKILIVFRGTVKSSIKDWMVNGKISKVNNPYGSGTVHKGMKEELDLLSTDGTFNNHLNFYVFNAYSVILTGHSQGGGEACIYAGNVLERFRNYGVAPNVSIIQFSPPRPGDKSFATWLMTSVRNNVRFELSEDPVTLLPLIILNYYHAGRLVYESCGGFGPKCHALANHYRLNYLGRLSGYLPSKNLLCSSTNSGKFESICKEIQ